MNLPSRCVIGSNTPDSLGSHFKTMENPYAAPQGEIIHPSSSFAPLTWKQILFSFQSRIPRRQYWAGYGIQMLASLVLGGIAGGAAAASNSPGLMVAILVPVYIFAIWSGLALAVKRCHDRDKSGWFLLVGLIPIVGAIWLFIEVGCLRGTEGANRFGEDPT